MHPNPELASCDVPEDTGSTGDGVSPVDDIKEDEFYYEGDYCYEYGAELEEDAAAEARLERQSDDEYLDDDDAAKGEDEASTEDTADFVFATERRWVQHLEVAYTALTVRTKLHVWLTGLFALFLGTSDETQSRTFRGPASPIGPHQQTSFVLFQTDWRYAHIRCCQSFNVPHDASDQERFAWLQALESGTFTAPIIHPAR